MPHRHSFVCFVSDISYIPTWKKHHIYSTFKPHPHGVTLPKGCTQPTEIPTSTRPSHLILIVVVFVTPSSTHISPTHKENKTHKTHASKKKHPKSSLKTPNIKRPCNAEGRGSPLIGRDRTLQRGTWNGVWRISSHHHPVNPS